MTPGSNDNEGMTPQSSRNGASPPEEVLSLTQNTD